MLPFHPKTSFLLKIYSNNVKIRFFEKKIKKPKRALFFMILEPAGSRVVRVSGCSIGVYGCCGLFCLFEVKNL